MKTLLSYYQQAMQTAITLLLVIIVLLLPLGELSDIGYYKTLFTSYLKNTFTSLLFKINYHVTHNH